MTGEGPLERYRRAEADLVRAWVPPGSRVLDLGAGTGFQARLFASWGCRVVAIDLPGTTPRRFWPVAPFDGVNLPFKSRSFDVVFSSNVLEHVQQREALLHELARVLKPGGLAVHVVPSASWRVWTSAARYLHVLGRVFPSGASPETAHLSEVASPRPAPSLSIRLSDVLFGRPHGEYPSTANEFVRYTRSAWIDVLAGPDWQLRDSHRSGLFYTGYALAPWLPVGVRRLMSRVLGSSCHAFAVERVADGAAAGPPP